MSRPRYGWWGYVKDMIRRYPSLKEEYEDLHTQTVTPCYTGISGGSSASRATERIAVRELPSNKQREYEAVRRAIAATERMSASRDRLKVIELVFWKRSHTLDGAALMIPCSYRTARRYHSEFIMMVASCYGLLDS
jgi:RinA family phage transcriptional activator